MLRSLYLLIYFSTLKVKFEETSLPLLSYFEHSHCWLLHTIVKNVWKNCSSKFVFYSFNLQDMSLTWTLDTVYNILRCTLLWQDLKLHWCNGKHYWNWQGSKRPGGEESSHFFLFYLKRKPKKQKTKTLESTKTTTGQMPTLPHLKILSYFRQENKPLSHSPSMHCWLRLTLRGRCNDKKFQLYLHYYLRLEIFRLNQRWHICVRTCIAQARETMLVIYC